MTLRPPQNLRQSPTSGVNPLDIELMHEKAVALGRLADGLVASLAALAAFDLAHPEQGLHTAQERARREALVDAAGRALWFLMVQRDACGLHRNEDLVRDYGVPREVVNCVGAARAR
ncbi:hypothetical protein QNA08_12760 [Chelatococcus sp. SYSU_G07232]|uniref:Uncharacterized protein n=1 Tax=Chelatococcus albus TaxID=3047466 RepID=A0ABT7AIB2_9HYPH|nr:DUF6665 family protein [Chelatococcus sp. SYSU_G07232]MDJ1159108.1 hypothetical protein [Chelatococcus sp. SYSU_G07232]